MATAMYNGQSAMSEGGLLNEIEKLVAPPSFGLKKYGVNKGSGGVSRWKSVNSQFCNSCAEGGELLCCDHCPASFHLLCHEPPIDSDQIPQGKWLCRRCRLCPELAEPLSDVVASLSAQESGASTQKSRCNGSAGSGSSTESRHLQHLSEEMRNALTVWSMSRDAKASLLMALSQAALSINASEFSLPPEMLRENEFPGCDKKMWESMGEEGKRFQQEPEASGILARPAQTCFACDQSSRKSSLIQCDFCPLLFHPECVHPPLCGGVPKEKWMCPNHIQHTLDSKMLKSCSFAERIEIWDKYVEGAIEEEKVKREFLSKARAARSAPFRRKRRLPARLRPVHVPPGIKAVYQGGVQDPGSVFQQQSPPSPVTAHAATPEEQAEWLSAVFQMQFGFGLDSPPSVQSTDFQNNNLCSTAASCISDESGVGSIQSRLSESPAADSAVSGEPSKPSRKRRASESLLATGVIPAPVNGFLRNLTSARASAVSPTKRTDASVQTTSTEPCSSLLEALEGIQRQMAAGVDADLDEKVDKGLLNALAKQRLDQLRGISVPRLDDPVSLDRRYLKESKAVLAVIQPPKGPAFPMQGSVLTIGKRGCHLDLSQREEMCTRLAQHHATILLDRSRGCFELLNYGAAGTEIDGVLYKSGKRKAPVGPEEESPEWLVRALLGDVADLSSAARPDLEAQRWRGSCPCEGLPESASDGWEGAAVLGHGSLIRMGCLHLVFALVRSAPLLH